MLKVALTGGIASGKTFVLNFFAKKGISTINSDKIVADLYEDRVVKEKVLTQFGTLDKKEIANQIFSSQEKKNLLEGLLHPLVVKELKQRFEELEKQNTRLVIVEVPLLFEAGLENLFDKIIAIQVSRKKQLARLEENGLNKAEAVSCIESQFSTKEKVKKSDFVIDNSKDKEFVCKQANKILGALDG
tara:strand:+ start:1135 stop:1698 length:564 start_codon:yes stop_codon:yes gene_type:complete